MKHDDELIERMARALSLEEEASENYWDVYVDLAQAALDAAFEWRDISTAPRDGAFVLGVNRHGENQVIRWMEKYHPKSRPTKWMQWDTPDECSFEPTHWLPLPPAPEE